MYFTFQSSGTASVNVKADVLGCSFLRVRKVTLNAVQPRLLAWRERERERERDRQTDRQRQRETDTERDGQTDRRVYSVHRFPSLKKSTTKPKHRHIHTQTH